MCMGIECELLIRNFFKIAIEEFYGDRVRYIYLDRVSEK